MADPAVVAPVPNAAIVPEINIPDPYAATVPVTDPYAGLDPYAPPPDVAAVAEAPAPLDLGSLVTDAVGGFIAQAPVPDFDPGTVDDGGSLNWFMIIVVAVVGVLTIIFCLYLIVIYQHPEDKNQAWFPKLVVLFGMTIAIYTVLMFPLDVTNSQACDLNLPLVDCSTTFPMDIMWQVVYIANIVTVFVLIPFAFFYYEGDSDWYVLIAYHSSREMRPRHDLVCVAIAGMLERRC